MAPSSHRLLSTKDVLRVAIAVLVCSLGVGTDGGPHTLFAGIAFVLAWLYGVVVIGRHVMTSPTST